jgi:hypothetical protein
MTTADTKSIKAAGRYFKATHPEGFASWKSDERAAGRPTTIEAAGRYIYEADPDMFDMVAGR